MRIHILDERGIRADQIPLYVPFVGTLVHDKMVAENKLAIIICPTIGIAPPTYSIYVFDHNIGGHAFRPWLMNLSMERLMGVSVLGYKEVISLTVEI